MLLAGHFRVLGRPYVFRGPDVAQACIRRWDVFDKVSKKLDSFSKRCFLMLLQVKERSCLLARSGFKRYFLILVTFLSIKRLEKQKF